MAYQMLEAQNQPLNFQIWQKENLQEKLEDGGSQPNQNFFLDDNDGSKKKDTGQKGNKKPKSFLFANEGKS